MDKLEETFNEGGLVEGAIISSVKGGLLVDVGVVAFLPASHVDDGYVKNLDEYIGKTYTLKSLNSIAIKSGVPKLFYPANSW
jgi:4-hydroxy-3-methylbut-2-enyl diphosphate reductase